MSNSRAFSSEDYTVGWICPLPCELAAAVSMLDERHSPPLAQCNVDDNNYVLGRIGAHNVVMTCLPGGSKGKVAAAVAATRMTVTFGSLRFLLLVGTAGGVPNGKDVRLGDVIISHPDTRCGGVVQYDFGKTVQEGRFVHTTTLNKPPRVLRNAVSALLVQYMCRPAALSIQLSQIVKKAGYSRPDSETDVLYESSHDHPLEAKTCFRCDTNKSLQRPARSWDGPVAHLGVVASGDQVMRWATRRDELWGELKMDCFEMEAAGLMDDFPCLVIRGISNYADSHKNNAWRQYAAAAAAAYARELLGIVPGGLAAKIPSIVRGEMDSGKEMTVVRGLLWRATPDGMDDGVAKQQPSLVSGKTFAHAGPEGFMDCDSIEPDCPITDMEVFDAPPPGLGSPESGSVPHSPV
ncbi:hypothetical protein S7711_09107 [Stachybotrys chartarum IBT 7711]|uniref:Nucleoside phosphorylase domain-containing protein n=1 Tax=Stachybotrys chartarum (strain CBS 109288 / IBT 7711) TaxID=1280523 RepID=A0A084ASB7_STACB|nr:hypothetical protein S7711_09107 [Stachybotrys chartarum IBT 7711]KFA51379.1 hypothetical protein S40293_03225 [Stachybotrys chartarum IBT 40293]